MVNFNFKWLDIAVIVLGVFSTLIIPSGPPLTSPQYAPNAVTGLATMAGISTAFFAFWLTQIYLHASEEDKKWMGGWKSTRSAAFVFFLFTGLLIVIIGLSQLVYGSLDVAYKMTLLGTVFIELVNFDVVMLVIASNLSK